MKIRTLLTVALGLVLFLVLLAACTDDEDDPGLANPASVYCEEQGGVLDMRETEAGTLGYCLFPDGSECEEWAYFRGECVPGQ